MLAPESALIAHGIFETLAYAFGAFLYRRQLKSQTGPTKLQPAQVLSVFAGAIIGAALGSKFIALFYDIDKLMSTPVDFGYILYGKTIVGGLLGALIGVETAKKLSGINFSTGDSLTTPLVIGMIIGRVGCFLGGVTDNTAGVPSTLPWAIDFGDGIPRHPMQLYEIGMLATFLFIGRRFKSVLSGDYFKFFMISYLLFRLLVDFWKPYPVLLPGLSAIQVSAIGGLVYYFRDLPRVARGLRNE